MSSTNQSKQEFSQEVVKKGDELVAMFNRITGDDFDVLKRVSKACAIILCDEMIEQVTWSWKYTGMGEIGELKHYIPYVKWQSVKSYLQSLK